MATDLSRAASGLDVRKGDQIIQGAVPAEDVVRSQMLGDHLGGQLVDAVAELGPSVAQTFADRLQPDQMDAARCGIRVAGEQPRQFGAQDRRGLGSGLGSGVRRRARDGWGRTDDRSAGSLAGSSARNWYMPVLGSPRSSVVAMVSALSSIGIAP